MSRQSVIAANKRNQFQQKQQVNRLFAQKLAQGLSPAQAATSVTVADGQSLDNIATQNGTDVQSLLAANPDMTAPKTGMVLNLPRPGFAAAPQIGGSALNPNPTPGSEQWRAQGFGGGLPSNAALGGTTTNPQGVNPTNFNMWQGVTPGYNQQLQPNNAYTNSSNPFKNTTGGNNPFAQSQYQPPAAAAKTPYPVFSQNIGNIPNIVGQGPYPPYAQNVAAVQQGQVSAPAIKTAGTAFAPTFRTKDDYLPTQLAAQVNLLGLNPTADQLAYLEKYGMITKTPQPAYSGGGGYGRRRHGGGGGGGGKIKLPNQPKQQNEGLPAFSSGAGFNGLVNWRI